MQTFERVLFKWKVISSARCKSNSEKLFRDIAEHSTPSICTCWRCRYLLYFITSGWHIYFAECLDVFLYIFSFYRNDCVIKNMENCLDELVSVHNSKWHKSTQNAKKDGKHTFVCVQSSSLSRILAPFIIIALPFATVLSLLLACEIKKPTAQFTVLVYSCFSFVAVMLSSICIVMLSLLSRYVIFASLLVLCLSVWLLVQCWAST